MQNHQIEFDDRFADYVETWDGTNLPSEVSPQQQTIQYITTDTNISTAGASTDMRRSRFGDKILLAISNQFIVAQVPSALGLIARKIVFGLRKSYNQSIFVKKIILVKFLDIFDAFMESIPDFNKKLIKWEFMIKKFLFCYSEKIPKNGAKKFVKFLETKQIEEQMFIIWDGHNHPGIFMKSSNEVKKFEMNVYAFPHQN